MQSTCPVLVVLPQYSDMPESMTELQIWNIKGKEALNTSLYFSTDIKNYF